MAVTDKQLRELPIQGFASLPEMEPLDLAAIMGGSKGARLGPPGGPPGGGAPGASPSPIAALVSQLAPALAPAPPPEVLYDCKISRVIQDGRLRVEILAPEDLLIDPNATELTEEKLIFIGDRSRQTRSDLKRRYPDKEDIIDDIPAWTEAADQGTEKQERDTDRWSYNQSIDEKASERVEVVELYLNIDYDQDGISEWRQVVVGGLHNERHILSNEPWGGNVPYTDLVANPMPHRWRGRSLFDDLYDIQRIKTVLMRQTLDNLYMSNNPQITANWATIRNPDALISRQLGSVIQTSGDPNQSIAVHSVPFVAKDSFQMLEYLDMTIEKRTGVSRSTMGLDVDALQHQTATAVQMTQQAAYTKVETFARNIAEAGGLKRLFKCLLHLFVENQRKSRTLRLRGEWVDIDPKAWNVDYDVEINVGLGAGSRDRDLAMLQGVTQKQELVIQQAGPLNPYVTIAHLFNTYRKMAIAAGLKNPEQYFPEITQEQLQAEQQKPPPPNPEQIKAQAQMQLKQMEIQGNLQIRQAELQAEMQRDERKAQADERDRQLKMEVERTQMEADIVTAQRKAEAEIQMMERKAALAERLALLEHEAKMAEMRADAQMRREEHQLKMREQVQSQQMQRESHMQTMVEGAAARSQPQEPGNADEQRE